MIPIWREMTVQEVIIMVWKCPDCQEPVELEKEDPWTPIYYCKKCDKRWEFGIDEAFEV